MPRSKSISSRRHRKVMSAVRGYKHARSRRVSAGKEALLHAGQYAYHGRKLKKRDLRALWIMRINSATREKDLSYSRFIAGLKTAKIELDRKILAEIAVSDKETFDKIVDSIR